MQYTIPMITPLREVLRSETRPIYLYGTGDGADKILAMLSLWNIPVSGIFVSEDFFRSQTFHEYECTTLSRLDASRGPDGFVVLIAFGSHLPEMIHRIRSIASTHTTYIPDVPVAGATLLDPVLVESHSEEIAQAGSLWADTYSKELFRDVLEYKLSGSPEPLFRRVSPKEEVFTSLIPLTQNEIYLDIGAYIGDTVEEFCAQTSSMYRHIYAMEPDPRTFRKLEKNTAALPEITLLNAAAGLDTHTEAVIASRGRGSKRSAGSISLTGNQAAGKTISMQVQKIDELEWNPTYVKMDVEGAEKEALIGMQETLLRCRPKLNIALYHRSEDLYELPLLLHSWLPNYRFYLRRHDCFPCWELNLYAAPDE